MARKRMIDPSMWINEGFGTLSLLGKLIFIGLFSNADDEGKGKASPAYIKAVLFPYNDDLRIADVEKTLQEVSSKMSVIFYSCDGNMYYTLTSWDTFQKIDRPSESKIPNFDEANPNIQRLFDESSTSSRQLIVSNRIEKNKNRKENKINKKEFVPPTLEEVQKYVFEKKLSVKAKDFYNYFTEGNWVDSKGNKVKNWKQKILTWNNYKGENRANGTNTNNAGKYKNIDLSKNRAKWTEGEIDDTNLI